MHRRDRGADDGAAEAHPGARAEDAAELSPMKVTEIAKISERIVTGML